MASIINNVVYFWNKNNGDYTHRLNYDLDENSIVFDLGGYNGWFTDEINKKYKSKIFCFEPIIEFYDVIAKKFKKNKNVIVFPLAVSNKNEEVQIYLNDDSTSMFVENSEPTIISSITIDSILNQYNINHIDLIKINIEGGEYVLLEYMIENSLIEKCENIQVQFHTMIDNYEIRYTNIKNMLEKTHIITYRYPFIWENWKKK